MCGAPDGLLPLAAKLSVLSARSNAPDRVAPSHRLSELSARSAPARYQD